MQYLWINYLTHEEDDPTESYVELGDDRRERRRMDFYDNGMSFAYGGLFGGEAVLSQVPYPDPRTAGQNPARCPQSRPGQKAPPQEKAQPLPLVFAGACPPHLLWPENRVQVPAVGAGACVYGGVQL